jgi:hypothetical protein
MGRYSCILDLQSKGRVGTRNARIYFHECECRGQASSSSHRFELNLCLGTRTAVLCNLQSSED